MTTTTWSDEEVEEEIQDEDEEISGNFVAFSRQILEDHEVKSEGTEVAMDDDYTTEQLEKAYTQLYKKWEAAIKANRTLSAQAKVSEQNCASFKARCRELETRLGKE